jgi:hypothetical protein
MFGLGDDVPVGNGDADAAIKQGWGSEEQAIALSSWVSPYNR